MTHVRCLNEPISPFKASANNEGYLLRVVCVPVRVRACVFDELNRHLSVCRHYSGDVTVLSDHLQWKLLLRFHRPVVSLILHYYQINVSGT